MVNKKKIVNILHKTTTRNYSDVSRNVNDVIQWNRFDQSCPRFVGSVTESTHSDHLAFFRRTLGTRLESKYKPYWNLPHLRSGDQQIQQAQIIKLSKRGFEEIMAWKFRKVCMSIQSIVAPGSVLYRIRGVKTMTITIRPSWNFLCII